MSQKRIFKVINDGEIAIQLYNPLTDLAGVLKVLRDGYMKDSNTFVAFEMNTPEAANARREYEDLIHAVLRDGISIIARHLPSMQIIGYCLNKIHTRPKAGQGNFYEEFRDNIQSEIVKKLLNFRIMKDKQIDVYEMYKTEYIFEPVYAAILPEYRMQDIAYHLVECTVLLAREISRGIYPDTMAEEIKGKNPKILFGSSNSKYSARIGEKLNFSIIKTFPLETLKVDGVPFSQKVPAQHKQASLHILKL